MHMLHSERHFSIVSAVSFVLTGLFLKGLLQVIGTAASGGGGIGTFITGVVNDNPGDVYGGLAIMVVALVLVTACICYMNKKSTLARREGGTGPRGRSKSKLQSAPW